MTLVPSGSAKEAREERNYVNHRVSAQHSGTPAHAQRASDRAPENRAGSTHRPLVFRLQSSAPLQTSSDPPQSSHHSCSRHDLIHCFLGPSSKEPHALLSLGIFVLLRDDHFLDVVELKFPAGRHINGDRVHGARAHLGQNANGSVCDRALRRSNDSGALVPEKEPLGWNVRHAQRIAPAKAKGQRVTISDPPCPFGSNAPVGAPTLQRSRRSSRSPHRMGPWTDRSCALASSG